MIRDTHPWRRSQSPSSKGAAGTLLIVVAIVDLIDKWESISLTLSLS